MEKDVPMKINTISFKLKPGAQANEFAPINLTRISGNKDRLNFNRADRGEVDPRSIRLFTVCGSEGSHYFAMFFLSDSKRPYLVDAEKINYEDFPGGVGISVLESLRVFSRCLLELNPDICMDEFTYEFMNGSAPYPYLLQKDKEIRLAGALAEALEKAGHGKFFPPPRTEKHPRIDTGVELTCAACRKSNYSKAKAASFVKCKECGNIVPIKEENEKRSADPIPLEIIPGNPKTPIWKRLPAIPLSVVVLIMVCLQFGPFFMEKINDNSDSGEKESAAILSVKNADRIEENTDEFPKKESEYKYPKSADSELEHANPVELLKMVTKNDFEVFIRTGHSDAISCLALSPDNKYALSGSKDCTLRLWNVETGGMTHFLKTGSDIAVNAVSFSPDSRFALSGSDRMRLWDVHSGREIRTFHKEDILYNDKGEPDPGRLVRAVAFSPDGQYVLAGMFNKVELYDTKSGQRIRTFAGNLGYPSSVAFGAGGKHVIAGGGYGRKTTVLWRRDSGEKIRSFSCGPKVVFSPDGNYALGNGGNLVNISSGEKKRFYLSDIFNDQPYAFSPDNKSVIMKRGKSGYLDLVDTSSQKTIRMFDGCPGKPACAVISADGKYVLSGGRQDRIIRLWELDSAREIRSFQGESSGSVRSVAFSPDSGFALAVHGEQNRFGIRVERLMLWDVKSGKGMPVLKGHTVPVCSASFSSGGKYLLTASADRTVKLWDTASGKEVRNLKGFSSVFNAVSSPDGKYAMAGRWLYDLDSGKVIRFYDLKDRVSTLGFGPDSRYAICAVRNTLRLWDAETGSEIRLFEGHADKVLSAAFSPDGKYLLSGSRDGTLKLWEVGSGKELRTYGGHSDEVASVAFGPGGRYALSGSRDALLKLWEVNSGREIQTFKGHSRALMAAAFSSDGKYVLSGSEDKSLRLWEAASGKELYRTILFAGGEWVGLAPQGYYLASDGGHKYLYVRDRGEVRAIDEYREILNRPEKVREIISKPGKLSPAGLRENLGEPVFSPGKYRIEKEKYALKLYDRESGGEVFSYTADSDPRYAHDTRDYGEAPRHTFFRDYAVSSDGKYILLAIVHSNPGSNHSRSESSILRVFETETGKKVIDPGYDSKRKLELDSSLKSVMDVDFTSDGKFIIGSFHSSNRAFAAIVVIWDFETGKIAKKIKEPAYNIHRVSRHE